MTGLNQIKRLNKNNASRTKNLKLFLKLIDSKKYRTDYDIKGSSNYAFCTLKIKILNLGIV